MIAAVPADLGHHGSIAVRGAGAPWWVTAIVGSLFVAYAVTAIVRRRSR